MNINPFKLERYFAKYEFSAPYLLSCSDCEALGQRELIESADENALKLWQNLKLGYTESQGHPLLREEIAKLYENIKPNQVFVITPQEGIFIAMNTLLKRGDHVITTFPGYQSLYEIANYLGCDVSKWEPKNDNGWSFDISELKNLIQENTKLIVINFPHNPTGAILKEEELKEIIKVAKDKNIILFSDEMYRFLEYEPQNRLMSVSDLYDNAISLFGMSKSFALAGLRVGWLTTKNSDFLNKFAVYKDYTTICGSAPSEILAMMALRIKDKILKRNLEIIKGNLEILNNFFHKHKNIFDWYKPKAGPIAFVNLKVDVDIAKFCFDLVEKKGVMLLPSQVYDFKGNYFRIGFARENIPKALKKLEEYLEENY